MKGRQDQRRITPLFLVVDEQGQQRVGEIGHGQWAKGRIAIQAVSPRSGVSMSNASPLTCTLSQMADG